MENYKINIPTNCISSMYYLKGMKLYVFLLLQIMLLCTMPSIHVYTYFSQNISVQ